MSSLEGGSPLDKGKPDTQLTDFDRRVFESMSKALWLPNEFKEYMVQFLALNQPPLSISQVFGFAQFTAQVATTIATSETTASTTYVDLATVGPSLSGLPDGQYLIFHGCECKESGGGSGAIMSYSVNGAAAADANLAENANTQFASVARPTIQTLKTGGSNSLVAKYRVGAAVTGTFASRFLIALRYANA